MDATVDRILLSKKIFGAGLDVFENEPQVSPKLFEAEKSVKTAIVMEKLNCTLNEAREKLDNTGGFLRSLID